MKFTVDCAPFQKVLSSLEKVTAKRNTTPILGNIYLKAEKDTITLRATDLELEVTILLNEGVSIEQEGISTIPAQLLNNIIQKLPTGAQVTLALNPEGSRLTLTAGKSTYRLPTLTAEDFPHMEATNLPITFSLSAKDLIRLFDQTSFAASTEETRYYLNGVYFHVDESKDTKVLKVVATDGHRLATSEAPLPEGAENMTGIIIPKKTVEELKKIVGNTDIIQINASDQRISCSVGNVSLVSKTIDGKFPDYKRVIPDESKNNKNLEISVSSFKEALGRISTLSETSTRSVKLQVSAKAVNLTVSLSESQGEETLEPLSYEGEDIEIGFNSTYLLDILRLIGSDAVNLQFSDDQSPATILDKAEEQTLFVLMPMRV